MYSKVTQSLRSFLEDSSGHLSWLASNLSKLKIDTTHVTQALYTLPMSGASPKLKKPALLIFFVVGGLSLNEAIELQSLKDVDFQIIAGGTHLLNSTVFINQLLGNALYGVEARQ